MKGSGPRAWFADKGCGSVRAHDRAAKPTVRREPRRRAKEARGSVSDGTCGACGHARGSQFTFTSTNPQKDGRCAISPRQLGLNVATETTHVKQLPVIFQKAKATCPGPANRSPQEPGMSTETAANLNQSAHFVARFAITDKLLSVQWNKTLPPGMSPNWCCHRHLDPQPKIPWLTLRPSRHSARGAAAPT